MVVADEGTNMHWRPLNVPFALYDTSTWPKGPCLPTFPLCTLLETPNTRADRSHRNAGLLMPG